MDWGRVKSAAENLRGIIMRLEKQSKGFPSGSYKSFEQSRDVLKSSLQSIAAHLSIEPSAEILLRSKTLRKYAKDLAGKRQAVRDVVRWLDDLIQVCGDKYDPTTILQPGTPREHPRPTLGNLIVPVVIEAALLFAIGFFTKIACEYCPREDVRAASEIFAGAAVFLGLLISVLVVKKSWPFPRYWSTCCLVLVLACAASVSLAWRRVADHRVTLVKGASPGSTRMPVEPPQDAGTSRRRVESKATVEVRLVEQFWGLSGVNTAQPIEFSCTPLPRGFKVLKGWVEVYRIDRGVREYSEAAQIYPAVESPTNPQVFVASPQDQGWLVTKMTACLEVEGPDKNRKVLSRSVRPLEVWRHAQSDVLSRDQRDDGNVYVQDGHWALEEGAVMPLLEIPNNVSDPRPHAVGIEVGSTKQFSVQIEHSSGVHIRLTRVKSKVLLQLFASGKPLLNGNLEPSQTILEPDSFGFVKFWASFDSSRIYLLEAIDRKPFLAASFDQRGGKLDIGSLVILGLKGKTLVGDICFTTHVTPMHAGSL